MIIVLIELLHLSHDCSEKIVTVGTETALENLTPTVFEGSDDNGVAHGRDAFSSDPKRCGTKSPTTVKRYFDWTPTLAMSFCFADFYRQKGRNDVHFVV